MNYDLEERLLEYSARMIGLVERLPNTRAGNHIASPFTAKLALAWGSPS